MKYYRLQKISEGSIDLKDGLALPLDGPTETGSGLVREERVRLSKLITIINDRFGTDLNDADQLFFDQLVEEATADSTISQVAGANPFDRFALVLEGHAETLILDRMEQNTEIFARYMGDPSFRKVVDEWLAKEVYGKLQRPMKIKDAHTPYDV